MADYKEEFENICDRANNMMRSLQQLLLAGEDEEYRDLLASITARSNGTFGTMTEEADRATLAAGDVEELATISFTVALIAARSIRENEGVSSDLIDVLSGAIGTGYLIGYRAREMVSAGQLSDSDLASLFDIEEGGEG